MNTPERERFEAKFREICCMSSADNSRIFETWADGEYKLPETKYHYKMWKAAIATRNEEHEAKVKELESEIERLKETQGQLLYRLKVLQAIVEGEYPECDDRYLDAILAQELISKVENK